MCLAALALNLHPALPVVLAANRDEFHARPAAPLAWWRAADGAELLSGRDLQAGGTWLGLTRSGRLGLLTNVRQGLPPPSAGPSRGELVASWLASAQAAPDFWPAWQAAGHAPFNLLMADLASGQWHWGSNVGPVLQPLAATGQPCLVGLSNAALDTPWPKLHRLKQGLQQALASTPAAGPEALNRLADQLLHALADRQRAPDAELPDTGVGLDKERFLSSIFIDDGQGRYGTRCSTVLMLSRSATLPATAPAQLRVWERRFDAQGQVLGDRFEAFALTGLSSA